MRRAARAIAIVEISRISGKSDSLSACGRYQERGVMDRAMVFAFMIAPSATGCTTQAELAEKMKLSRSQVNEYVKQFSRRFAFVSNATYSQRQRECCAKRRKRK